MSDMTPQEIDALEAAGAGWCSEVQFARLIAAIRELQQQVDPKVKAEWTRLHRQLADAERTLEFYADTGIKDFGERARATLKRIRSKN